MEYIPGKSELLAQIEREQRFWEQLVAEIGEDHMLEPGATDAWTFKDVVAHLNGWRTLTLARLEAAIHGQAPVPPWPAELSEDDDLEEINAWIYANARERPLQEVLDEHRQSFQRMRDALLLLSEHDLTAPGRYPWLNGYALAIVITHSFGHLHDEHEPALRAWLDQRT